MKPPRAITAWSRLMTEPWTPAPPNQNETRSGKDATTSRTSTTVSLPSLEEQRKEIAETRRSFNEWLSGELGAARRNGG